MYIRCWGSRGSIPVSGSQYQRYGGDTTCMEVRSSGGDIVIVDAGSGIRRAGERLAEQGARNISVLFTHAHLDHVVGFPFFVPLYSKGSAITVYGCPFERESYREILQGVMCHPYCPVDLSDRTKVVADIDYVNVDTDPFSIGSLRVTPIHLSHPDGGLGFRFEEDGASFVFLTDNELDYVHPTGLPAKRYAAFARGADLLIHDAEYTKADYSRTWGHSLFDSAVRLGIQAGVKQFGLFHVNQRRSDEELTAMVEQSRDMVKNAGAAMECFAVGVDWETVLGPQS